MTLSQTFLKSARALSIAMPPVLAIQLALAVQPAPAADPPATSAAAPAAAPKVAKDSVLAIVNAEPLTRRRIGEEAMLRYGTDIVDGMVDRYLVLQACKEAGIHISNQDVQNEVIRVAGKFGLSPESYLRLLEEERDITPEQYSSEVIWPMLALRALVADQVTVTQEEFDRAFISQYGEAVKCRMILVSERSRAEELLKQAKANPDSFGQLAAQHSEDAGSASVRGLIPPIRHHIGDPELEKLAFGLKENEISEPFQLGDQWAFLQCVRKLAATPPSEEAFPAIRTQITDRLRDEKVRGAAGELFQELRQKAQVVKVFGNPELEAQYPGVAAIINQQKLTIGLATEEAIKRHGQEILEGEINRTLLTQALKKKQQQVTEEDVQREVERAAIAFGFVTADGKADVDRWLANALEGEDAKAIELYKKDAVWPTAALKKLIDAEITVTEEDLKQGFEKNFGPRVEVQAIVLGDQRTAQKVWDMARNNPTEKFFGELAAQYSIEPTSQSNFGKVPPIRRFGGQPAIEEEAFALQPGGLSGIIATGDKYILLRCQGRTEPLVSDPSAVREELTRDIHEKKERIAMAATFDEIKQSAQIDNFLTGTTQDGRVAEAPQQAAPAKR
ncbi:peptidylprolyl isomerase [Candidatus Laterigemmans baculatus]|uniref:peptidylprolyl isomerase n=1 Tax=Candidatus Laterigemmans baculatus TaxID=2770505 RepID=UPI001F393443|nr:peptidylprolyl isomerase [Candidatus Laterigemmans baculatus]